MPGFPGHRGLWGGPCHRSRDQRPHPHVLRRRVAGRRDHARFFGLRPEGDPQLGPPVRRPPGRAGHVAGHVADRPRDAAKVLERIRGATTTPPELASLTEQERVLLGHIAEGLTHRHITEQCSSPRRRRRTMSRASWACSASSGVRRPRCWPPNCWATTRAEGPRDLNAHGSIRPRQGGRSALTRRCVADGRSGGRE